MTPRASDTKHQCWLATSSHYLIWLGRWHKTIILAARHAFHRWRLGRVVRAWLRCWGLKGLHWLIRTIVCEKCKYFQFVTHFFQLDFSEKSETTRLQLCWPLPNNYQFENDTERALRLIRPDKSLYSLYLWINRS